MRISDSMIRELSRITTRDDSGQHFTEWSKFWEELEFDELIEIYRPVHEQTGIPFSQEFWQVNLTERGKDLVSAHPELCD